MNETEFISTYPVTSNLELASRYHVSVVTVQKWAARLGLKKDAGYLSGLQRQKAMARVLSEESRGKLSAKAKGRKLSEETKAKILQTKRDRGTIPRGPDHYNWRGGRPWE